MFTIDPSTGRADRIVIEGAFGLGESVVSGSVSPDRYVVAKPALPIVSREVHHKELTIEPAPAAARSRGTRRRGVCAPVLDDGEVRALADLAIRIERHYGAPQDTEWAFDADGAVWMLQSRPVTSAGGTPAAPSRRPRASRCSAASAPRRAARAAGAEHRLAVRRRSPRARATCS